MSAPVRVCAHVKKGICPACANPTAAPKAERRHYVTDFGRALIKECRQHGVPTRPKRNQKKQ